jgi:hypothetical protein
VRIFLLASCFGLLVANAYQAITGRRLSKRPSRRSDEQVRRESTVASAFLAILLLLVFFGG